MAASIWANRRLVLTVERAVYSHDSQFITAPDGYRVVSGGWAAANPVICEADPMGTLLVTIPYGS